MIRRGRLGMLVTAMLLAAGAHADWDETRTTFLEPLSRELHNHLPTYARQKDLSSILALYDAPMGGGITWAAPEPVHPEKEERHFVWRTPGTEPIRERWERLFTMFATIDRVDYRIHAVDWDAGDDDVYPAVTHMIVRGEQFDGTRAQVDEWLDLRVAHRGDRVWKIVAEDVRSREMVTREHPRYEVATARAGIDDVHRNVGSPVYLVTMQQLNGGGAAVADVDRDGCEDILLSGSPNTVLYRNRCDGTFEDVTKTVGLPSPYPDPATGVVFFDYDNDGWPDLYVGAAETGDRLFHNVRGRFEDVTERAGIPRGRWTSMPVIADYDRDGLLDLYLVRMGDHAAHPPRPNYAAYNGVPNTLLRNRGDGTFEDVTKHARVGDTRWGLAGAWFDYDDDGWPDLYLGNEFGPNGLLRNRGDGTFEDVTARTNAGDPGAAMSVSFGDYDGDGDLDVFVSNMYSNTRWAIMHPEYPAPYPFFAKMLRLVMPGRVHQGAMKVIDGISRGSTLLRNDGGTFTDVSDAAGVRDAQWGWAAEFVDYDNDGALDLYASDGFYTGNLPDDV